MSGENVLVVGLGEVGKPVAEVLSARYRVLAKDVEPLAAHGPVNVMHICYPFQIEDFGKTTVAYIDEYRPALTIIHSTVVPGTTRAIQTEARRPVAYSPVRGKHSNMQSELMRYTKFVGAVAKEATSAAVEHLSGAGFRVDTFGTPEALELAKLLETTYFGLLIGWAQEMERYALEFSEDFYEIARFTREIDYLPPVIFQPGFIGGHCVMPNIKLLENVRASGFLEAIKESNERKGEEWLKLGRPFGDRLAPVKP